MFFPWHAALLLALESQAVIGMRSMKLLTGGWEAHDEAQLMVGEKVSATIEAAGMMLGGRSIGDVIGRYREHVAANSARLLS